MVPIPTMEGSDWIVPMFILGAYGANVLSLAIMDYVFRKSGPKRK